MFTNHIVFPISLNTLGGNVFNSGTRIPSVTFLGAKPATVGNGIYNGNTTLTTYIYHPNCASWETDTGGNDANRFSGDFADLSARWRNNKIVCIGHPMVVYTVDFNGNTQTGGSMGTQVISNGVWTALNTNRFWKTGHTFVGWTNLASNSAMFLDEAPVLDLAMAGGSVTLTALWKPNPYIVYFDGNDETDGSMSPQTIAAGIPTALTANGFLKTGYDFVGWTNLFNGGEMLLDEAIVEDLAPFGGSVTLTAVWEEAILDIDPEWVSIIKIDLPVNGNVDLTLDDSKITPALKSAGYVYVVYTTTDLATPLDLWETYEEDVDAELSVTPRNNPVHVATLINMATTDFVRFFKVRAEKNVAK